MLRPMLPVRGKLLDCPRLSKQLASFLKDTSASSHSHLALALCTKMQDVEERCPDVDDEIEALTRQLAEISAHTQFVRANRPWRASEDDEIAITVFHAEVTERIRDLNNMVLTRSAARAAQAASDKRSVLRSAASGMYSSIFGPQTETTTTTAADATPQTAPAPAPAPPPLNPECSVCFDCFAPKKLIHLSCSDRWCIDCLKIAFLEAAKDESIYPPKCCRQIIPFSVIKGHMSAKQRREYEDAEQERAARDMIYCADANCRKLIFPQDVKADRAEIPCRACGAVTCTVCQNVGHEGECPEDAALKATLALVEVKKWKRCYSCRRVVELWAGCFHVT